MGKFLLSKWSTGEKKLELLRLSIQVQITCKFLTHISRDVNFFMGKNIFFTHFHSDNKKWWFQHKRVKVDEEKKMKDPKLLWGICVTCFSYVKVINYIKHL